MRTVKYVAVAVVIGWALVLALLVLTDLNKFDQGFISGAVAGWLGVWVARKTHA